MNAKFAEFGSFDPTKLPTFCLIRWIFTEFRFESINID